MKPTTLAEALSMVPIHWLLTPGVDVWQDGDEEVFCSDYGPYWSDFLRDVGFEIPERKDALTQPIIARRPIPQDVRESAAWWLLYNTLAEVDPKDYGCLIVWKDKYEFVDIIHGGEKIKVKAGISYKGCSDLNGLRKYKSAREAMDAVPILGGPQQIIKELSAGPDPIGRWILAGKP